MKKLIALALIFLSALSCFAIEIDANDRIENIEPGYCAFCSLEMLGRHHKIEKLFDLVKNRTKEPDEWVYDNGRWVLMAKNLGHPDCIERKLKKLEVKYWIQRRGNFDRTLLECADEYGCMVGMKKGAFGEPHAIVITSYNEKEVRFVDPNSIGWNWVATREWFDYWWDGYVIVISD